MEKSTSAPEKEIEANDQQTNVLGDLFPKKGERALSIGQTGSGKTTFNRWLLERLPETPVIIYDTKHDSKFDELKNNRVAESMAQIHEALDDVSVDYVIVRPPPMVTANPVLLDRILQYHEENWRGVDAYLDELYHFHKGAYAGPGLNGLYTRGRSRGITTIGSTQRPANVSGFVFSETQLFYVFYLGRKADKKRVADFIEDYEDLASPPKLQFHAYRQGDMKPPQLMKAVPVADVGKLAYTDHLKSPKSAGSEPEVDAVKKSAIAWL